jgi:EAL domain-containing protein (putative c-di-GMP-specific phosphodiesterase class I)
MPIDALKIDRSFVSSSHSTNRELVHLMARAAHAFGLRVIAEGVEAAEQIENLADCSVEAAQGYYFSRPVPAQRAAELVRACVLPLPAGASRDSAVGAGHGSPLDAPGRRPRG